MVAPTMLVAGALGAATIPLGGAFIARLPGGPLGGAALGAAAIFAATKLDGIASAALYGAGAALVVNAALTMALGRGA